MMNNMTTNPPTIITINIFISRLKKYKLIVFEEEEEEAVEEDKESYESYSILIALAC